MELYNVVVEAFYEASYEGKICRNYTSLVFANTEKEAIDFMEEYLNTIDIPDHRPEKAVSAYKVDSGKGKKKRKPHFYK